eukprot:CAMPEP_0172301722 /NCGR_PEP_ID=MMETSP1058-20130122/3548_1 /TAXON_ID=83371 /ORGANISM="Detonula confervacea, Strain CCMP 353" /LENGTH=290 /DNA_ID=CAMNT_0013011939 /DNA_START=71 /DNA_END=943 /DNA_ORIENTATION=-
MMNRNNLVLLLLSLCCQLKAALGFLPAWMPGVTLTSAPELTRYTGGQTDTILDARLSVGLATDQQLAIDGFQFQLCNVPMLAEKGDDSAISLPGAHGPRPHLSSGVHHVNVIDDGSFVNMEGLQNVQLRNGVWEIIWRDESPAGLIICGFSLDKDARRNDAMLEKGQVYVTWPVWSKDGLDKQQARKAEAAIKYEEFETERNTQLEKMSSTPNILRKALHYRNAADAAEKMDWTGLDELVNVPSSEDVLEIGEGLQMVKTGTVWSKTGSFSDSFGAYRHQLLGSATLHSR